MKRIITLLLAFMMVFSLAVTVTASAEEKIQLTFFHRWPNEPKGPYMDEVIRKFEEAYPNIDIVVIDPVLNDPIRKIRTIVRRIFRMCSCPGRAALAPTSNRQGSPLDDMDYANQEWAARLLIVSGAPSSTTANSTEFPGPWTQGILLQQDSL